MNSSWDDEALSVYEEAMPGYEVIGFTGSWESTDALHCRTKGVPDIEMLQIFHSPINDIYNPVSNYVVNAEIVDLSQTGIILSETNLYWKNDNMTDYEVVPFVESEISPNNFEAEIPISPVETNIKYYISSADYSGRSETLPIAGYFQFYTESGNLFQDGDVNMDEVVNIIDVVSIVNHVLGQIELDNIGIFLADINNDNVINILDIISIVNLILGN